MPTRGGGRLKAGTDDKICEWIRMTTPQIALATDMAYLRPTLVAMASAIAHAPSGEMTVHVLGVGLDKEARELISSACRKFPNVTLNYRDVSEEVSQIFPQAVAKGAMHPMSSLATLLIPKHVNGRVLYLDSDTITRGDLSALFNLDMGENLIAAVREWQTIHDAIRKTGVFFDPSTTAYRLLHPFNPVDDFNAGVMLMDCDGIKKHDEFVDGVIGKNYVEICAFNDQLILNILLKGKVTYLGMEWNCRWGRSVKQYLEELRVLPRELVLPYRSARIIHFIGKKPWKQVGTDDCDKSGLPPLTHPWWIKHGYWVAYYRMKARRILRFLNAQ